MLIAYSLMVKLVANQFLVFRVAAVCNFPLLMLVVYFALSWSVASEFLSCFFRANLILVAYFVLCVACEKALLGFSIRSRQSAPGELVRRLCFVPREWWHILSVCGVCCMFYCG